MAYLYGGGGAGGGQSASSGMPVTYFRLFTKESLTKIERRRVQEDLIARELQSRDHLALTKGEKTDAADGLTQLDRKPLEEERLQPNPQLEVGRTLPFKLGNFPPELYGKPIEDLDQYYQNKYVSITIIKYNSIY